jgi:hypothetical protein
MHAADDVPQGRFWRGLLREDFLPQLDGLIEVHKFALLEIGVAVAVAYPERRVLLGMMQARATEAPSAKIVAPAVAVITITAIPGIATQIAG